VSHLVNFKSSRPGADDHAPHSPLLTVRQVASLLGLGASTVYRRALSGDIPAVRLFDGGGPLRFRREVIDGLVKAGESRMREEIQGGEI